MSDMISFTTQLLGVISSWLMTPPMFYFVGVAVACFVVRIVRDLLHV